MKNRFSLFLAFLMITGMFFAAPSALAAPAPGEYDLFVSPEGDDAADGTISSPLKTLEGAKQKLKALKGVLAEGESVNVWFRSGRYEFTDTVYFTGDDLPDVNYRAYNNEPVVFSGAREVTGFTEETVNGVRAFVKKLDEGDPSGFKSLFKGDEQLRSPRYPETGYFTVKALCPEDDIWTEDDTPWEFTLGQRSFYADPADLPESFTNFSDVQVRILHFWHDELMYLTLVDYETGKLGLSRPSSMKIRDIDRYYFENVFEAMNEPGEWYLNTETNTLYYVPGEGESAEDCVLKASTLECMIDVNGVSGISFEGIRFTETDWNVPVSGGWAGDWRAENDIDALQAALDVKGVVTVANARNVGFTSCEFVNLGADGVKFTEGAKSCFADSCLFSNIAATGIFIGGANGNPGDDDVAADITVKNNIIRGYGRKFYCAIGIHITYCDGAVISNNEISDGYYTAISCGWVWGYSHHLTNNIKIKDNLIYNIGQGWLSDMGGIYMLGIQPGTELSGNVIHNVAANPGEGGYGGWGIYLDEGSSRMLVENNLVFMCASQSFNIHYGEGNIFRNNIGAFSAEGQVSPGSRGEEPHATAAYYDNIFVSDNGAPIYVYMLGTSHFYDNGNLFWDVSKGADVCFSTGGGATLIGLSKAKSEGFIHNETVADPLFNDASNFDFTLSDESPAFALNFKSWDYDNAGTLKGSTVGFGTPGGQTAYNDCVSDVEPTGSKSVSGFGFSLMPALIALCAVLTAFWPVSALIRSPQKNMLLFLCTAAGVLDGWFIFRNFVNWSPVLYSVGAVVLCAILGGITALSGERAKKPVLSFFIISSVIFALFFGLVLLLNNLLRIGEENAITIVLTLCAVYAAVCFVRRLLKERKGAAVKEE